MHGGQRPPDDDDQGDAIGDCAGDEDQPVLGEAKTPPEPTIRSRASTTCCDTHSVCFLVPLLRSQSRAREGRKRRGIRVIRLRLWSPSATDPSLALMAGPVSHSRLVQRTTSAVFCTAVPSTGADPHTVDLVTRYFSSLGTHKIRIMSGEETSLMDLLKQVRIKLLRAGCTVNVQQSPVRSPASNKPQFEKLLVLRSHSTSRCSKP